MRPITNTDKIKDLLERWWEVLPEEWEEKPDCWITYMVRPLAMCSDVTKDLVENGIDISTFSTRQINWQEIKVTIWKGD